MTNPVARGRRACIVILILGSAAASALQAQPIPFSTVHYGLELRIDPEAGRMDGTARLRLVNRSEAPARTVPVLLYRLLRATDVRDGTGSDLAFDQEVRSFDDFSMLQVNQVRIELPEPCLPGDTVTAVVDYGGHVLGYEETGMAYIRDRIEPAFTLLRSDTWAFPEPGIPSISALRSSPTASFTYRVSVAVPEPLVVANGGRFLGVSTAEGIRTYEYESLRPSWRMDFAAAPFLLAEQGPLRLFYLPEDEEGATNVMNRSTRALSDLETRFGPLHGASTLTIIEIPEGWGAQADVTAIIQPASAFRDPTAISQVYHELAHLWQPPDTDLPSSRWNEGLSTFQAARMAHDLDGGETVSSAADRWLARVKGALRDESPLEMHPWGSYGSNDLSQWSYTVGGLFFFVLHDALQDESFDRLLHDLYQDHARGAGFSHLVDRLRGLKNPVVDRIVEEWMLSTDWVGPVRLATTADDLPVRYR